MTTTAARMRWLGYPPRVPAEVVALLVDDGFAQSVAAAAVREAVHRQAPVRFLQVVPMHLDDEARARVEEGTFRAGLHALRGHPRTPGVFEVIRRRLAAAVRRRSQSAALLVVGIADQLAREPRSLTERCAQAANCPVRTVPVSS